MAEGLRCLAGSWHLWLQCSNLICWSWSFEAIKLFFTSVLEASCTGPLSEDRGLDRIPSLGFTSPLKPQCVTTSSKRSPVFLSSVSFYSRGSAHKLEISSLLPPHRCIITRSAKRKDVGWNQSCPCDPTPGTKIWISWCSAEKGRGFPGGASVYLPASTGDIRDVGSIPGSGRFPWRRAWQPTPLFLPGESHGHDWSDLVHTQRKGINYIIEKENIVFS